MAKVRQGAASPNAPPDPSPGKSSLPSVPAAELLSFLKGTRGAAPWTESDLAKALKIGLAQAKEAIAALQLQGYIESVGRTGNWRTSEQGEFVSGAKPPRYTRHSVETALAALSERIKAVNADQNAPYKITGAVAFGDFLSDQARVQAAEVGIRLARKVDTLGPRSAKEYAAELALLKQLRGKTTVIKLQPYEEWMSARTHRTIL